MKQTAYTVANLFEDQALTSIVGGFSFASAIAWMDLVRFVNSRIIRLDKSGGKYYLLTAVITTIMAIVVFLIIKHMKPNFKKPQQPVYAVTG